MAVSRDWPSRGFDIFLAGLSLGGLKSWRALLSQAWQALSLTKMYLVP